MELAVEGGMARTNFERDEIVRVTVAKGYKRALGIAKDARGEGAIPKPTDVGRCVQWALRDAGIKLVIPKGFSRTDLLEPR